MVLSDRALFALGVAPLAVDYVLFCDELVGDHEFAFDHVLYFFDGYLLAAYRVGDAL